MTDPAPLTLVKGSDPVRTAFRLILVADDFALTCNMPGIGEPARQRIAHALQYLDRLDGVLIQIQEHLDDKADGEYSTDSPSPQMNAEGHLAGLLASVWHAPSLTRAVHPPPLQAPR